MIAAVARSHPTVRVGSGPLPVSGAFVAVLVDWTGTDCDTVGDHAWAHDVVLVPVRRDGLTTVVGPVQYRGAPVCLSCAEHARATVSAGRGADDAVTRGGITVPFIDELVDDVVDELVGRVLAGPVTALADRVWTVRASDLTVSDHRARPRHEGCARCHPLPPDSALLVRPPAAAGPAGDPTTLRVPNPRTTVARLRAELADWRHGPVVHSSRSERLCLPIAHAEIAARVVSGEGGYGRAATFADAERTAWFEALERITGMSPGGRRTSLTASFDDLGEALALDPVRLGRHDPAAVADRRFALAPYDPATPMTWAWGWSAQRGGPLAVPEQAAYWGVRPAPGRRDVLAESSNGCGLGNSPEEAALFGLFEIAERDAFLMAWYARTPLQRVAVPAGDTFVGALGDRLASLGYDLLLFDATNDLDIPVVVSLALHRDPGTEAPQAFFAAGAHTDPRRAIAAAVVEVVVNVEQAPNVVRATPAHFDRARLRPMLDDPGAVSGIEDHVGLAALPESRSRFEFLLGATGARPWREVWPGRPVAEPDPAALLARLRRTALAAGVDTVVVDQSEPRSRATLGLHAARVVAPGAISLTFGHLYRRTLGLRRLLTVPAALGRREGVLDHATLRLDPHPFP